MNDPADYLPNKRVLVVGLGRSGVAAARAAKLSGAIVVATDNAPSDKLSEAARSLPNHGIEVVAGGHLGIDFAQADLIVMSPGVPSFPALVQAEAAGVSVIGEIELSYRLLPKRPLIAITGSNGKSTTTTLVGALLAAAGRQPFVGGNIGTPPCELLVPDLAPATPVEALVLEVSSFQCERMPTFRPTAAALLNVSPNHLDRYRDFEAYVAAKGNLFDQQGSTDWAIAPAGDAACLAQAARGAAQLVTFATVPGQKADVTFTSEEIVDNRHNLRLSRGDIQLSGNANASNICAALALLTDVPLQAQIVARVLSEFSGLPHRNVRVRSHRGVAYYDDSKATSVGATVAAVSGLAEPKVVLIAGGRDKMGSYTPLVEALVDRGRAVVLIGEAAQRIADSIGDRVPVVRAIDMVDAVGAAASLAQPGDAVLLSPACSSFDMFRDYAERGESFAAAVGALT